MSFVSHIFTWISSSKQNLLRYLPTFGLKFSWKRPKNLIFGRYFCDILCDISVKWAKKRAIFFCDCDMEKNPCDTLFFKLYHIAPALTKLQCVEKFGHFWKFHTNNLNNYQIGADTHFWTHCGWKVLSCRAAARGWPPQADAGLPGNSGVSNGVVLYAFIFQGPTSFKKSTQSCEVLWKLGLFWFVVSH